MKKTTKLIDRLKALINRLLSFMTGHETNVRPAEVKSAVTAQRSHVPDPSSVLGENYGNSILWPHQEDQYVNFVKIKELMLDNKALFDRYFNDQMTPQEKEKYPYHFYPCFGDSEHLASVLGSQLYYIDEDRIGVMIQHQRVLGALIFSKVDSEILAKDAQGVFAGDYEPDFVIPAFFQIQFMRLDPQLLKDVGIDVDREMELAEKIGEEHLVKILVNFAPFKEND